MNYYEELANATVKVEYKNSCGSGFFFLQPGIVVTNHHVVEEALLTNDSVIAITQDAKRHQTEILSYSDKSEHDYAVLRIKTDNVNYPILKPRDDSRIVLGEEILFSGYPHGISHLLIHRANISCVINQTTFYVDGSVNGGNSGGPIIDVSSGDVVGIITQRRFLGGSELSQLGKEAEDLYNYCQGLLVSGSSAQIMGIDFGGLLSLISRSLLLNKKILVANANTGIGIGYSIEQATQAIEKLNITSTT